MGIITNGIFGGFSKKTGALVGVRLKNLNVIRSLPLKSGKPATAAQVAHRLNFGKISALLSLIKPLVDHGYAKKSGRGTAMNRAVKANMKTAFPAHHTDSGIDFTRISFSEGPLLLPMSAQASAISAQLVSFSWTYQQHENQWRAADDLCTVLVYNTNKQSFVYQIDASIRSAGNFNLATPSFASGDVLLAYLSFRSLEREGVKSNSSYINTFTLP